MGSGTFISKMQLLLPSLFSALSSKDLDLISVNDKWVSEVFEGFWEIALEKFLELPEAKKKHFGIGGVVPQPPVTLSPVAHEGPSMEVHHSDMGREQGYLGQVLTAFIDIKSSKEHNHRKSTPFKDSLLKSPLPVFNNFLDSESTPD